MSISTSDFNAIMIRSIKISVFLLALLLVLQCRESYVNPHAMPDTGYLVVEGYITGNGPTRFTLSHTLALDSGKVLPPEKNAVVQVEGNDNSSYALPEQGNGIYQADTLPLNPAVKYRLHVHTAANKEYLSDYAAFKITPLIDSISWKYNSNGVDIYANTHDPSNNTRYYQWQYNETWQYNSAIFSIYKYDPASKEVVTRNDTDLVYDCWRNTASTTLILGSSAKLAQDVIYLHPLVNIPPNAQQIGIRYSIIVRQYALTEEAFNYLTLMQKNSETLGSIFDAQPSQLKGNIHCVNKPEEPVIGFVSAGTLQQQRIFISRSQLPSWRYIPGCLSSDTLVPKDPASLSHFYDELRYLPINAVYTQQDVLIGWNSDLDVCIDCRLQGGVNKKPSFWPN
jgi:hypothetical protein